MNHVALVGNICRDIEKRQTQSGVSVVNFGVAVQRRFRNSEGNYDADFIECVAWRETADFIHRYFIKGNKIGLTGSIQTRTYDAQDGSRRKITEVVVETVEFVAPKSNPLPAVEPKPMPQQFAAADDSDQDDLPF